LRIVFSTSSISLAGVAAAVAMADDAFSFDFAHEAMELATTASSIKLTIRFIGFSPLPSGSLLSFYGG
jgi:hypothetical protein